MLEKEALEKANSETAHNWHAGLGLEYGGVDLGDAMTYEVLRVLGTLVKQELDKNGQ